MKISIIGTGGVARTLATRLTELNNQVTLETRDPAITMSKKVGEELFSDWLNKQPLISIVKLGDSAKAADLIINATSGAHSIEALLSVGKQNLSGKIILDLSNPLDFSNGMPPSLFVSNTRSLSEEIQTALEESFIVKSLNTLTAPLMLNPNKLKGDHIIFICGNSESAKTEVCTVLKSAGWISENILDLGDLTASRGLEQLLPLWIRIYGHLGSAMFNFNIVKP